MASKTNAQLTEEVKALKEEVKVLKAENKTLKAAKAPKAFHRGRNVPGKEL